MTIWAIVPVKPLRLGKSRLANVLTSNERALLNRLFLQNTLEILNNTSEIGQTLVVSRDPAALALAREYNARTVLEDGNPDLNSALTRATQLARMYAPRGVLVLPADLPLLAQDDLRELVSNANPRPCAVISPDRHDDGTNAMLVAPGGSIPYLFGPGSFHRHCAAAEENQVRLSVVRNKHIGLDLDTPEDLTLLRQNPDFIALTASTPETTHLGESHD